MAYRGSDGVGAGRVLTTGWGWPPTGGVFHPVGACKAANMLRGGVSIARRARGKALTAFARGGYSVSDLGVMQSWPVVTDPLFDVLDAPQLAHGHLVVRLRETRHARELVDALARDSQAVFDLTRTHQVATHKQDHRHDPTRHLYNGQSPDRTRHVPSIQLPMRLEQHVKCETHRQYALTCEQYEGLLARSGVVCERCGAGPETCVWGKLAIDHDASVGQWAVRGLLCTECNTNMRRIQGGDQSLRRFIDNAWYLQQLARLGLQVGHYPEPLAGRSLIDPRGRRWRRGADGWLLVRPHHKSWGRFPVAWHRLVYTFGPINLKEEPS